MSADRTLDGAELIAAERRRQVEAEGWTPEHDDEHADGALASAAACCAQFACEQDSAAAEHRSSVPYWLADFWPNGWDWKPDDDRIRTLVKAGALIAAEIDRLQRRKARGL